MEMVNNFSITYLLISSIFIVSFLKFSSSQKTYTNVSCFAREKRALLQFRNGLIDESNRLSSWFGQEDCCSWEGIGCDKNTGHVVTLDLSSSSNSDDKKNQGKLRGEINSSLLALKHLNYLDLSMNNFSGIQIPVFFGSLKKLKYLNLSWSGFNGKIPHELGNLSHLQHLDLSWQWQVGYVLRTESLSWVTKLSSLQSLDLSSVNLNRSQDWFQVITMLPSLRFFKLRFCQLRFWSESDFAPLVNRTSLTSLNLGWNYLYSTMPIWLFNMTSLEHLDLGNNYFYGLVPYKISELTSLTYLDIFQNYFGGPLPLGPLCNLSTSLTVLNLLMNHFHGSIPKEIGCFEKLNHLKLSSNELNGTIASDIGLLSNLEELDISFNPLIGEMSESHFEKMSKLKVIYLIKTSLILNISSSWIPPFQLEVLRINSFKMGPHFPSWLRTQKNLKELRMSDSGISGKVPDWFEIINVHSPIYFLDLALNNLSGEIPDDLPFSSMFKILLLNDNSLKGSIPESICQITTLNILALHNNQLSERLPMCLGNLRNLLVLKLENNRFHGQIPSSLGYIKFLHSLGLSKNTLSGEIPQSMQYLEDMVFLDLGENGLEGIIPSWVGEKLSKLRILRLQSNRFSGDVPIHICRLSKLQVLNLAGNNLTGYIPGCFNNLNTMVSSDDLKWESFEYGTYSVIEQLFSFMGGRELQFRSRRVELLKSLDLSNNYVVGGIPNELMELVGLRSLNLCRNHLSGNIPERIGNLRELISLDLSVNQLSGSIPQSLGNLNFLSHLNLSSNQLSGRIPTGNQLQTLNDPSIYAGNNGLCGKPLLTVKCSDEKSTRNENFDDGPINEDEKNFEFSWFLAGSGPGFGVGHLLIFCIFLFKKSWRIAYFQFVDNFATYISSVFIKIWKLP